MEHLDHPSPHFNDTKMGRFCSFAPSSLLWGIVVIQIDSIVRYSKKPRTENLHFLKSGEIVPFILTLLLVISAK